MLSIPYPLFLKLSSLLLLNLLRNKFHCLVFAFFLVKMLLIEIVILNGTKESYTNVI